MKRTTLKLHKEVTLFCEEGMTSVEIQNALLIPEIINKLASISKPQKETKKSWRTLPKL
jgi:hypothetical protein